MHDKVTFYCNSYYYSKAIEKLENGLKFYEANKASGTGNP